MLFLRPRLLSSLLALGAFVGVFGADLIGNADRATAVAASTPGNASCADGREADALRVRSLQNRLMVGALACDQTDEYDAFVRKYDSVLSEHGRVMSDYFARRHGAQRAKRLVSDYLTAQANRHSLDSMRDRPGFCAEARDSLGTLLDSDETSLHALSAALPSDTLDSPLACVRG